MRFRYGIIMLAVFLAVVVIGAVYVLPRGNNTPTPPSDSTPAGWTRITDSANLYSIEVPRDWKIVHEGAITEEGKTLARPSWIGGESPDWQIVESDPSNQLSGTGHITRGAAIEIYVFTQDISGAPSRIHMVNKFVESKKITIDGIEAELRFHKEYDPPRHEEGVVLNAIVHRENTYYFRIAYNPTTYPQGEEVFMRMLQSIKFIL